MLKDAVWFCSWAKCPKALMVFLRPMLICSDQSRLRWVDQRSQAGLLHRKHQAPSWETLGRQEGHKECWREKTDCKSGDILVITALIVRRGQISTKLFSEGSACRQYFIVYPVPGSNLVWVHAFVCHLSPSWTLSSSLAGLLLFLWQAKLVLASEALNWPCRSLFLKDSAQIWPERSTLTPDFNDFLCLLTLILLTIFL